MTDSVKGNLVQWEHLLTGSIAKKRRSQNDKSNPKKSQVSLEGQKKQLSSLLEGGSYLSSSYEKEIAKERVATVTKMRDIFQKLVIRRTNASKSWDNETEINSLPPLYANDYILEMNETEWKGLEEIRSRVVSEVFVILFLLLFRFSNLFLVSRSSILTRFLRAISSTNIGFAFLTSDIRASLALIRKSFLLLGPLKPIGEHIAHPNGRIYRNWC